MEIEELTASMGKYYGERIVTAIIGIECDVNKVDIVAVAAAKLPNVEDAFVVTGDYDIILKVRFPDYDEFQHFLVEKVGKISGVKKTRTMMVLSIKKEMGQKIGE
ncbi:MAG: Lrp/AsnC ligand binding domain-containing protein [Candidatus Thermoplasmatota archaeon]|nr:Lrp/AsnC ligand binding domain-containing protein [Candidatus Thermoplasmatota archaeon]